ncbi:MAG: hypothetical protein OXG78_16530 [Chloroflexi bacterium]|nr:hypothetical protein [Chloroflexota bacterium]
MKHKHNRPRPLEFRFFAYILLIFPAMGILAVIVGVGMLCQLALPTQNRTIRPVDKGIEEILIVPLNGQEPVYTENKYSDWVAISVSGSVERNGEFFLDALHLYNDLEQGSQGGFRGLLIDGKYAYYFLIPTPDYRDDHTYRFPYSVYRNIRDTDLHLPKTIGFQMISEAASGLDGEFIVEVSSDPFKHWPEARGR